MFHSVKLNLLQKCCHATPVALPYDANFGLGRPRSHSTFSGVVAQEGNKMITQAQLLTKIQPCGGKHYPLRKNRLIWYCRRWARWIRGEQHANFSNAGTLRFIKWSKMDLLELSMKCWMRYLFRRRIPTVHLCAYLKGVSLKFMAEMSWNPEKLT